MQNVNVSNSSAGSVDAVDQLTASLGSCSLTDVKRGNGGSGTGPFSTNYTIRGYKLSFVQLEYLEECFAEKPNPSLGRCEIIAEALSVPNCLIISNWFIKRRQQPIMDQ